MNQEKKYNTDREDALNDVVKRCREETIVTLADMKAEFPVLSLDDLEGIPDYEEDIELIVAVKVGGGIYEFKTRGEYQLEWCGE